MTGAGRPTMSGSVPFHAQEITVQRNAGARRRDRGAATLELAIVLPVLVSVVFGIIDFARLFNAEIQVSQAAREGVRLASLVTTTNTPAYTTADVTARVQLAAPAPGFGSSTPVTVAFVQPCPNTAAIPPVAVVRVTYPFDGVIWHHTLSEQAVMRCVG
jgi:Flp pilus assembly protein TadG